MPTTEDVKLIIKETVKASVLSFAKKQLKKKPKFQILDLIIPKERKIRSIVGGLETSLGTTLWEPLAKALALQNGFTVRNEKLQAPVNMPNSLSQTLQLIIEDRKKDGGSYNAAQSHSAIKQVCQAFIQRPIESFEKAPKGRGVDIWLEKNNINYFFDTKTVQPKSLNFNSMHGASSDLVCIFLFAIPASKCGSTDSIPIQPSYGRFLG